MPTIDKVYPNTKPVNDPYTHDWVQAKIDAFLRKGGEIKEIPRGAYAQNAEPMSAIRRRIEKEKNFGDDVKS